MSVFDHAWLAARLIGAGAALLVLPGLLLVGALGLRADWHLRLVLAFALSYVWVFLLAAAVPFAGWSVDAGAALTAVLLAALAAGWLARRRSAVLPGPRVPFEQAALALVAVVAAAGGWIVEPPFTGEEALDLASIARIADGQPLTFENTSLMPATRPVYLFQPYQFALGLVARWADVDPLVALVKFRALLAPLAALAWYAVVRSLARSPGEAVAAFGVLLLFVGFDVVTWEWNSLFPFVRRGSVSAGILVPVMLALSLAATRHTSSSGADPRARRTALITAPLMLVAAMATHPLEMLPVLCFVGGMVVVILLRLDPDGSPVRAATLMLALFAAAVAYVAVQSQAVPYVADYERGSRQALREAWAAIAARPVTALTGGPTEARDILSRTIPATTAVVAGGPLLIAAALRAPAAAAMLALGVAPLAVLYVIPGGYLALTTLTSSETVRDVNAYFSMLGLLSVALGLTAIGQAALHGAGRRRAGIGRVLVTALAGSLMLWAAAAWGPRAVALLAVRATERPELLVAVAAVTMLAALAIAATRPRGLIPDTPHRLALLAVTAALALPLAAPEWGIGDPFTRRNAVTAAARLAQAGAAPTVLDWPTYYEQLKTTIAPPLPVPRAVVDRLRRELPPRQVLLANPQYSCALAPLVNAYCVNPERIYGHYFQPAARYHAEYVTGGPERRAHPFFDGATGTTTAESRLLDEYAVIYVLADPEHAGPIAAKLQRLGPRVRLQAEVDGFLLYRIGRP